MSSKTLLDTLKAVSGELGFSQPMVVLSSQVATDIQLKQLAIAAGEELLDAHDWQALIKKYTVTVTPSLLALPFDFHRIIDQTMRVGSVEIEGGPTTSSWTRLNSGERRFRVIGDQLELFDPTPFIGQSLTFYYVSKNFVIDGTGGLLKADFTLDSDKTIYHARMFTSFIKLKFLQIKNLDTRAAADDFNAAFEAAKSNDTPSPVLWFDGEARLLPATPWSEL